MSEPLVSRQTAIDQLRKSDERWGAAVRAFDVYPVRLRALADAASNHSRALTLADLANVRWTPRPGASNLRLAYELEPASDRPGPKATWRRFDQAVKEIGRALEGDSIIALGAAFAKLGEIATELADGLETDRQQREAS
jgi:hypothetical protein